MIPKPLFIVNEFAEILWGLSVKLMNLKTIKLFLIARKGRLRRERHACLKVLRMNQSKK
jgi:hypothetical protein